MKETVFIFMDKTTGYKEVYGSISRLFEDEGHKIDIKIQTFYNSIDLSQEDYETESILIAKRTIKRKKQNFL